MKIVKVSILVLMCVLLFTYCKCHREDTPSPDPCIGKSATGAMFNLYENARLSNPAAGFYDWINYVTDTVTADMSQIDFVAADANAVSYNWTIGANTYTTKKVTINFSSRPAGQKTIPITLLIKKQSTNSCLPADTGTMTLTKLMVVSDSSIVSGRFNGYKTDTLGKYPSDTFTVYFNPKDSLQLYDSQSHPTAKVRTLVIKNLYPGCTNQNPYDRLGIGYKEVEFNGSMYINCYGLAGKAILGPTNNDITIHFGYTNPLTNTPEYYIFKGKRIQ